MLDDEQRPGEERGEQPTGPESASEEQAPQGEETPGQPLSVLNAAWAPPLVAFIGGLLGLLGAAIQELRGGLLVVFVAGPMIEEATKPAGLYVLLAYRPSLLKSRLYAAYLSALAGLAFGAFESLVYVTVYVDEPTASYTLFRFTVPVALHTVASFIFGLGITPRLRASVAGEVPFLSGSWPFFIAAAALHSAYNITVTVLGVFTDALTF